MKKKLYALIWIVLALVLLTAAPAGAAVKKATTNDAFAKAAAGLIKTRKLLPVSGMAAADTKFRTGRLIVKTKASSYNFSKYKPLSVIQGSDNVWLLQFSTIKAAIDAQKKLSALSAIRYAEPDEYVGAIEDYALSAEATTLNAAKTTWGAAVIGSAPFAEYVKTKSQSTVTAAVVDTGIYAHSALKSRLTGGYDFIDNDAKPSDLQGHGTHVAGIIHSCSPDNVKIMPVRVLDENGCGCSSIIALGIRYAADHGASVINLSLRQNHSEFLDESIRYAIGKKVVVVAASGNDFSKTDSACPAHIKDVIVVGATNKNDNRAAFSNFGNSLDVVAPGVEISSTSRKGTYTVLSGTSMAAPHVTAAAAMMKLLHPGYAPSKIETLIRESTVDLGEPGWDRYYGTGRLQLRIPNDTSGANEVVKPEKVTILASHEDMIPAGSTAYLNAIIKPDNTTERTITWSSSNTKVATVSDGIVKCKKAGTATISVKTSNGKTASLKIKVFDDFKCKLPPGTINVPYSSLSYTKLEADRIAKTVKRGTTPIKYTTGLLSFTAPASKTYNFTFFNLEPLIKSEDEIVDSIGAIAFVFSYDSGYYEQLEVSTQGGKSKSIWVCSSGYYADSFKDGKITSSDFLPSRTAKLRMKKGQKIYLWLTIPSRDTFIPRLMYLKIA